jgi:hypothetical protein
MEGKHGQDASEHTQVHGVVVALQIHWGRKVGRREERKHNKRE